MTSRYPSTIRAYVYTFYIFAAFFAIAFYLQDELSLAKYNILSSDRSSRPKPEPSSLSSSTMNASESSFAPSSASILSHSLSDLHSRRGADAPSTMSSVSPSTNVSLDKGGKSTESSSAEPETSPPLIYHQHSNHTQIPSFTFENKGGGKEAEKSSQVSSHWGKNMKVPNSTIVTDEISNKKLRSLDENHKWMAHVRFMVIGAQKAGTTSLFMQMKSHSQIKSKCKECKCFASWRYDPKDPLCKRSFYFEDMEGEMSNGRNNSDYAVGDYSPGYIFQDDALLKRISSAYPWVKIIAILREPGARAFSEFQMRKRGGKVPQRQSFEDAVLADLRHLYKAGMLPHFQFGVKQSPNDLSVQGWLKVPVDLEVFDRWFGTKKMNHAWLSYWNIKGIAEHKFVSQGFYAVGLWRWLTVFPRDRFLVLHADDQKQKDTLKRMMERVFHFIDLPFEDTVTGEILNSGNYTKIISADVKLLLEKIYKPFNAMIEALFVDYDERWKDPFPYEAIG